MPILLSRRRALALLALGLGGQACGPREPHPGTERPLVLVLGPTHTPRNLASLEQRLAAESRLQVALRTTASSVEAVDLVQSGRADVGLLSLFDYLLCADLFDVEPLAQMLRRGGQPTQRGVLVTPSSGGVADLQALAGRRVGYVDPYSVTGFLLAAKQLRDAHIASEAVWLGSHQAVLDAVRDGRVAAGATYAGGAARAGLRDLAVTGEIANEPVFAQRRLPPEIRAALAGALMALRDTGPLSGLADATGFSVPLEGTYESALATVRAAGKSVEDMVPGGWARANEQRRPLWAYAP